MVKKDLKVKDHMIRDVLSAKKEMPITALVESFCKHRLHTIPIVDEEGNLIGIISIRDILKLFMSKNLSSITEYLNGTNKDLKVDENLFRFEEGITVESIMKFNAKSVDEDESVLNTALMMFGERFHRLPVTRNRKLVGIISQSDVLKALGKD